MEQKLLTVKQLSRIVNRTENTLIGHFERTRENLRKKGILITRYGTGPNALYTIDFIKKDEDRI